ncbi:PREDICTED: uncharacterized protein LOC104820606 [Tarenaya hassleriana]|uniref:uncharacterized protein LOC104820606 n=1 Tax=Tarenaya hassleriana TaxID=28532 RepID=UPI00053C5059|nr:PREDICTED: uncharacterized protein LOC104820606 [Tarenaya hassleriana]
MVARKEKNSAKRRKLHFPTNLSDCKLKAVIGEALVLYISLLKLKIEALNQIKNQYEFEEVKVEKIEERFQVKVRCQRGGHKLVQVLEAFEEMGLEVIQARVSCQGSFSMEAIVEPRDQGAKVVWDVDYMTQILVQALVKPNG